MNPFEPDKNPERQTWWPDTSHKPEKEYTAAEPDEASSSHTEADTIPEPAETDPAPAPAEATSPDTETTEPAEDTAAPDTENTELAEDTAAPDTENAEPAENAAAPDPSRPLPGESYADFIHRLDRERMKTTESADYGRQEYWAGLHDYGKGVSGDPNYGPIPEEFISNGMSKAAFICGIAALVSILFNGSMFFGSLGILFALLSRKNKFSRQARIGLWMSIAGVATFLLMLIISISLLVSSGVWNRMMDIVQNLDPNQEISVSEIQQELMDEVLSNYGVQRS